MKAWPLIAVLVVLPALAGAACGDDDEGSGGSSAAVVSGGSEGKGVTYKISGPISAVTDCGVESGAGGIAPPIGRTEDALTDFKLQGKKFTAAIGATTDLPSRYASYTGELREDGSFRLESDYSSPGDIHVAILDGSFTDKGEVRGTWTFGLPGTAPNELDDPNCRIEVSPLESSFYYGVEEVDWREAFGVR